MLRKNEGHRFYRGYRIIRIIVMKAMSKQQLADCAGVSVRTLMAWCRPYAKKLEEMGLRPRAKVLEPHIVKFLIHKLCIDVPP